jgi:hypothetical protein
VQRVTRTLALSLAAAAVSAAPAHAQSDPSGPPAPCPSSFLAVPAVVAPDADKNTDGIICIKATPSQNERFVIMDNPR